MFLEEESAHFLAKASFRLRCLATQVDSWRDLVFRGGGGAFLGNERAGRDGKGLSLLSAVKRREFVIGGRLAASQGFNLFWH